MKDELEIKEYRFLGNVRYIKGKCNYVFLSIAIFNRFKLENCHIKL